MKEVTTFVGIDAHKKDLFVAMVVGAAPTPVTWQVANEPRAVRRMVRELARARDDAREDLQRCRHRLGKLLLRRGLHYAGTNWTQAHRRWVDSLSWSHTAERTVVEDYQLAIDHTEARLLELDARLAE